MLFMLVFLCIVYYGIPPIEESQPFLEDKIILRLAENHDSSYPTYKGIEDFIKRVYDKSNGRIDIRVYNDGLLGNDAEVIEQVQYGGIDFACISSSYLVETCNKLKPLLAPYLFPSGEDYEAFLDSNLGSQCLEQLSEHKLVGLCWYETSQRIIATKTKLANREDFQLLKIGVQPSQLLMDQLSILGAAPVPLDPRQFYNSLSKAFIDGVQADIITYYQKRYYAYAPYIYATDHVKIPNTLIASRVTMMQLSKEDQEIIVEAAQDSIEAYRHHLDEQISYTLDQLTRADAYIVQYEEEGIIDPLRDRLEDIYVQFDEDGRKLIEEVVAMGNEMVD